MLVGSARAQCEDSWTPETFMNGLSGYPLAMKSWDDGPHGTRLYIAGSPYVAGFTGVSNGIVAFDGNHFSTVGPARTFECSGMVTFGGQLWVGGTGSLVDDPDSMGGMARWDGERWLPVPKGLGTYNFVNVDSITATGDGVVVTGRYYNDTYYQQDHYISAGIWDGRSWRLIYHEVVRGSPYPTFVQCGRDTWGYGGWLPTGNGPTFFGRLSGSAWISMSPPRGVCYLVTMTEHLGAPIASLRYQYSDGTPQLNAIFRWDGTSFQPFGADRTYEAQQLRSAGGTLYDLRSDRINMYVESTGLWVQVPASTAQLPASESGNAFLDVEAFRGRLFASGRFSSIGGTPASRLAAWDGTRWAPAVDGFNGSILSIRDDVDGQIAVGSFTHAPGVAAACIARYQAGQWSAYTTGVRNANGSDALISGAVRYHGDLIVAGKFDRAGDVVASNVAKWDGRQWSSLGTGLPAQADGILSSGNMLFAFGNFHSGQTLGAKSWNGSSWVTVPNWPGGGYSTPATAFNGKAYFGSNGVLWAWDGLTATGTNVTWDASLGEIRGIAQYRNELLVFGRFNHVQGFPATGFAAWNGSVWRQIGDGFTPTQPGVAAQVGDALIYADGGRVGYSLSTSPVILESEHWRPLPKLLGYVTCLTSVQGTCLAGVTSWPCGAIASLALSPKLYIANSGPEIRCNLGGTAGFNVTASGNGTLRYQWRRDGINLYDSATPWGSVVRGTHTAELTISGFLPDDVAYYDCVVSDDCRFVESDLMVPYICIADANGDGGIDGGDLEAFFGLWQAGSEYGDVNFDGGVDGADIEAFITSWAGGGCS
jgi:hypothetical protein